ncbi:MULTISPECIES: hypothetical protein [Bacillota]|uniref:hypothetical protein n=1 Tax=Bacillota TaxID=1239 RepID=UPI000E41796B|nr:MULTISPECIES: hypothetical protein [Bacillota]RGB58562.1 hypothetical protein DW271_02430 [Absiella sp. AM22-9]
MNILDALKKAMQENKCIALPTNEHCENNGYLVKLKPFENNLLCLEFYGLEEKIGNFSLPPCKILRNDWIVI